MLDILPCFVVFFHHFYTGRKFNRLVPGRSSHSSNRLLLENYAVVIELNLNL